MENITSIKFISSLIKIFFFCLSKYNLDMSNEKQNMETDVNLGQCFHKYFFNITMFQKWRNSIYRVLHKSLDIGKEDIDKDERRRKKQREPVKIPKPFPRD